MTKCKIEVKIPLKLIMHARTHTYIHILNMLHKCGCVRVYVQTSSELTRAHVQRLRSPRVDLKIHASAGPRLRRRQELHTANNGTGSAAPTKTPMQSQLNISNLDQQSRSEQEHKFPKGYPAPQSFTKGN